MDNHETPPDLKSNCDASAWIGLCYVLLIGAATTGFSNILLRPSGLPLLLGLVVIATIAFLIHRHLHLKQLRKS